MSALELSKEMVSVEGYLADARLIIEKQIGLRVPQESYTKALLEVARMLQVERHHKKPRAEKILPITPKATTTDQVMSSARANPQVPPMMSSTPEEASPKRSHSKKVPVAEVVKPARVRSPKPKVESKVDLKAKPKAKTSRRR